jgi:pimeloyl-ACP methyl ester carboxylesterase
LTLDWRGHGESGKAADDFGATALTNDALSVIRASAAQQVIPVALAHSGWIALQLRRELDARIPKLVLLEWLILGAPPPFLVALDSMQSPQHWRATVDVVFEQWLHGVDNPALEHFVRDEMGSYGFDMWSRAAREIAAAYNAEGNPLAALARLDPQPSVLHLYSQPADESYLEAQEEFAVKNTWFHVKRLHAHSHFPMFEVPDELAQAIEEFAASAK